MKEDKLIKDIGYTDALIMKIVKDIGVPLPTYNYNSRLFEAKVPVNISIGSRAIGAETCDSYKTFTEACEAIIEWHKSIN